VRATFGPRILFDSTGATGDTADEAFQTKSYCRVHHKVNPVGQPCYAGSRRLEGCKVGEHLSLARCDGYTFTEGSKRLLVEHLRNVLGHGYNARIPNAPFGLVRAPRIPVLRDELTFYTWMDKKLQTDALFSLALACWEGLWDELGEASFGSVHGE
jgi:hypothetical protein